MKKGKSMQENNLNENQKRNPYLEKSHHDTHVRHKKPYTRTQLVGGLILLLALLAILVLVFVAVKKANDKKEPGKELVVTEEQQGTDTNGTEELPDTESTEKADTEESPELSPVGTTKPTSVALATEQIDIAGLDTTHLSWGQGSNVDELNRPAGCDMYQDKYGHLGAYFIEPEDDKVIYLTMDEGYEYGMTPAILDTLKEKQVPCVFFVTKPYAQQEPELVQRMIDEGHQVGNHSVTHPSKGIPSLSVEEQYNEINEMHNYIKDNFDGYEMHLFRYPAGIFTEQSLAIVNNCGYRSVFWSFAYMDYDVNNQPDPTEALNKVVSKLHPGAIYLLHAESETNTKILGQFIDEARAQGYRFEMLQ